MLRKAKPLSRAKIRQLTVKIREYCELNQNLDFPIMHFLEGIMPYIFDSFELEVVEDNQLDCEARAYPNEYKIIIKQSVYDGACNGIPCHRFTVAHEIGHMFLHHDESISFARGHEGPLKTYEKPEWQANTFAGELLAPPYIIRELTIEEVVIKCKVSRSVAEIQKKYC